MKPLVSILIPAFNAEKWIADTIRSALAQTWPRIEIIVVDDGSSDQTLAVARRFASENVTVVTQENGGASAARNKAFSLSRGDYTQWLDADDLLAPDKIATQMEALAGGIGKRTLLSSEWASFYYRFDRARFEASPLWGDLSPVEWLVRKMGQNLFMQPASWLVSRELTEAAGPWDTRLSLDDDGEYFCRVILASDGIRFVPQARSYYRISGAERLSTVGRSDKKLESQFLSMQLHVKYLRSLEESERVRSACVYYLQTWLNYFYPDRLDLAGQLKELALELGGRLEDPHFSWKYAWIQRLFGWELAKGAQSYFPRLKTSVLRSWDKTMHRMEFRKTARC